MDQTLKQHEELIDKHEFKLEDIQKDLIDIKVRLGIKDKTNGQVIEYQQQLVDAQEKEREERVRGDTQLREDIKRVDDKTWMILTGVILAILIEVVQMLR